MLIALPSAPAAGAVEVGRGLARFEGLERPSGLPDLTVSLHNKRQPTDERMP